MDDEINLLDYIKVIMKWKNLIIAITVLSMLIAFVYSKMQPKMYKAEVTLLSMNAGLGGLAQALAASPLAGMIGGASSGGGNNVEAILKSRALAKNVVENNDLEKFIFKNQRIERDNRKREKEPTLDDAAEVLQGSLTINAGELTRIQVVWDDPEFAARLANAYAKELVKFLNQKAINVNVQILDEALPPISRYKPNTKANLMVGGVIGLFFSVFLVFVLEYWDKNKKGVKLSL